MEPGDEQVSLGLIRILGPQLVPQKTGNSGDVVLNIEKEAVQT